MTIRVLLADDNEITRRGLTWIMDSSPDIEVCGEAVDGQEAVARAGELQPDVVLLDVRMPRLDGLESIGHLLSLPHPPRVLMLTTFHEDESVRVALRAGAAGFLLKDTPPDDLLRAIRDVHGGHSALGPPVARRLVDGLADRVSRTDPEEGSRIASLTPREHEVLRLLARGLTNTDIASALGMTEGTVKGHVSSILAKLGADSRVQAARIAYRTGLDDQA
ncbi:response regulator transcription factor [Streptomyces sp. NBC_00121]|uniref:response regulator transcription factor n=1 Tax=Streptomyces TaxID=1883 RepID=UPI002DD87C35|nr:response regulator transcription factor [Streptomyces sp. NBC_01760]WSC73466.1 response regulator transcription factor [Streptomyces sp. NBC_01760]